MSARIAGLLIVITYIVSRVLGLEQFPCYFHSDEATPAVHALKLYRDFFVDGNWYIPPLFYQVAWNYNLCTTVYLQLLGLFFAPTSLELTRGLSALASVGAILGLFQIAARDRQMPHWWLPGLCLFLAPLWFLHSRTGFEVVVMVATYALALGQYATYRDSGSTRAGVWCVALAIMSFHSYSAAQVIVPATFVFLALFDFWFHLSRQMWKRTLALTLFGFLLLIPYIRFRYVMFDILAQQLKNTSSPFTSSIPWDEKVFLLTTSYLRVLNPLTWFTIQPDNIIRHQFGSLPAVLLVLSPFTIVGAVAQIRRFRDTSSKIVMASVLAAPLPSMVSSFSFLRSLTMLLPMSYLTAAGIQAVLGLVKPQMRSKVTHITLAFGLGLATWLSFISLKDGCLWSKDYTLYGYQWGTNQMFRTILPKILAENPTTPIWMSSTWAHSPEVFKDFFKISQPLPLIAPGDLTRDRIPDINQKLFIFTADDVAIVDRDERLVIKSREPLLSYPNGQPGFFLISLDYSPRFEELLLEARNNELRPHESVETLQGEEILLTLPGIDIGPASRLVDGDDSSLIRGSRANPFNIQINWKASSKEYTSLEVVTSHHNNLDVSGSVTTGTGIKYACAFKKIARGADGAIWSCEFSRAVLQAAEVTVSNPNIPGTERANMHINEVKLK